MKSSEGRASSAAARVLLAALVLAPLPCVKVLGAMPVVPPSSPVATRSVARYVLPAVTLVRDDGRKVALLDELDDGRPVVLNFIFTSCPGICPLSSQMFEQLQRSLGADPERVHLVSISIDPDVDTPPRLRAYARQFHAGPGWQHYTGAASDIESIQRAFDVYSRDKMAHRPLTLVRPAPGARWIRFDGFATAASVLQELPGLQAASARSASAMR